MRKILFLLALLGGCYSAHASVCTTLAANPSQSTVQSALNSCGSGNEVVFVAGNTTITSSLTWPCGVSITGPTVTVPPGLPGVTPTATITTSGFQGYALKYPAGCSVAGVVFRYMELNGNGGSNGGGGGIQIGSYGAGGTGPDIEYNWIHGMQPSGTYTSGCYLGGSNTCGGGTDNNSDNGIFVSTGLATNSSTLASDTWTGLTIKNNRFGAGTAGSATSGDCSASNMMQTFYYAYQNSPSQNNTLGGEYNNLGGYCNAVGIGANTSNLTISNNNVFHLEQGFKWYEPGGNSGQYGCGGSLSSHPNQYCQNNTTVQYDDFYNVHRIWIEAQQTPNTTMNFQYLSGHDSLNAGYGSWELSLPMSNQSGTCTGDCTLYGNALDNLIIANSPQVTLYGKGGSTTPGIEWWGQGAYNYNFGQGNISCLVHFGWTQPPGSWNSNLYQGPGSVGCTEESEGAPTGSGNTRSATIAALTSVQPTISPASGTFSGSQVVTFANGASATNRDANTGIWYTTDGSTPTPGSGTATYIASGGTITVSATTTVKAVGMWGARNQPTSYASGYGYVPSAVVTNTYTGGTPTAATPTMSPTSESFSGTLSVSISSTTPSSTIYYTTNGTTPTTSSPVYSGSLSISATTTVQAIATASGVANSSAASNTYTLTAAPSLTGGYQGNATSANTATIGAAAIQQVAYGTYSDGNTRTLPDSYGNTAVWSSSNTAILSVTSSGMVSCVGVGTANSLIHSAPGNVAFNAWGWTCSGTPMPTLSGVSITLTGGGTAVAIGGTIQACANMSYTNPVESTQVCGSGTDAYGNSPGTSWHSLGSGVVGSSTSGLLTGVSAGSATIGATVGSFTPTLGVTSAGPALQSGHQGNMVPLINRLVVGTSVQQTAYGQYADGSTHALPDGFGNSGVWSSSNSAILTVNSTGLATCVAPGTANARVTAQPANVAFSAWTFTCTASQAATVTCAGNTVTTQGHVTTQ